VAGEPRELRGCPVSENDIQIVVGVFADHALVGVRSLEDEAEDIRIGGGELDERNVGQGLLSSHGVISGERPTGMPVEAALSVGVARTVRGALGRRPDDQRTW
jgi:hypothetical protein